MRRIAMGICVLVCFARIASGQQAEAGMTSLKINYVPYHLLKLVETDATSRDFSTKFKGHKGLDLEGRLMPFDTVGLGYRLQYGRSKFPTMKAQGRTIARFDERDTSIYHELFATFPLPLPGSARVIAGVPMWYLQRRADGFADDTRLVGAVLGAEGEAMAGNFLIPLSARFYPYLWQRQTLKGPRTNTVTRDHALGFEIRGEVEYPIWDRLHASGGGQFRFLTSGQKDVWNHALFFGITIR